MKAKDITGQRFGLLTVIERAANNRFGGTTWDCRCDCGGEARGVYATNLKSSHVTSCGCLKTAQNRARWRKAPGHSGRTYLYSSYRRGAQVRGYEFKLTFDEFIAVTQRPCFYCGAEPKQRAVNHQGTAADPEYIAHSAFTYNGVDRLDNDLGYIPSNVVPCCATCNRAKGVMNVDEFLLWVRRVSSHQAA